MKKALRFTSRDLFLELPFKQYKKFLGLPFEKILEKMKVKNDYKKIKGFYEAYSLKYINEIKIKKNFLKELKILKKD